MGYYSVMIHATTRMNLKTYYVKDASHKRPRTLIPLIWNAPNRQTHGWWGRAFLTGPLQSILGLGSGDVAQPCKCTTELHTLKWWILWYVNHISINRRWPIREMCLWNSHGGRGAGGCWFLLHGLTLKTHWYKSRSASCREKAMISSGNNGLVSKQRRKGNFLTGYMCPNHC